ncbi:signal transduction histidine kinase [Crossiella equi]|uniref:histidine kinase n=1 Tax=Crossiella equi TaxID=130796 RepID=A0ABS5ABL9_9PSEU|nr:sensor histidine kinase [Crossiella equi]MBP2473970.1 signal transduction histidine kinase [Crossiella equi]
MRPGWYDGWALNVLVSGLLVYSLVTSDERPWWTWLVLGPAFACWVGFLALDKTRPVAAVSLAAVCSLSASALVGAPGSAATTISAVALMVFIMHRVPSLALGFTLAGVDLLLYLGSAAVWRQPLSALATSLAVLALLTLLGLVRRQQRTQQEQASRLVAEAERARLARELHDVLAHSLGALAVQLEVAEALLSDGRDPEAALARVRRSRRLAVEGLHEARQAVAALRADVPPLPTALAELAQAHERDHQTPVRLATTGTPRTLSPGAAVSLVRTAREALTNAAKHASGATVDIGLSYLDGAVCLSVRDGGGRARETVPGGGFGLTGMRERLALVGGTLTAGPDGDGWLVRAEVPE